MSTQQPLVSIIIPAFNQANWIRQCLLSVLAQPVASLEVLVVDDGSTDATVAIAQAIARQDGRVRVLQQAHAGAGAARNHGLQQACGEYVHFVDADDWLPRDAYRHWHKAVQRYPHAQVLLSNFNEVDNSSGHVERIQAYAVAEQECQVGSFKELHEVLLQGPVVPWNRWLQREFVQKLGAQFDEIAFANDRAFHFRTVVHAQQVVLLGDALVNYRVGNSQSLAGQIGLPRLNATLHAFRSITNATAHLTPEMRYMAFSQCMKDLIGLYTRAHSPAAQLAIAQELIQALKQADWLPFSPFFEQANKDYANISAAWWSQWQVLQHIAQGALNGEKTIPVVFAVNDAYVPYMTVAIQSLSDSLAPSWRCAVFVLHLGLPGPTVQWLQEGLQLPNVKIHCVHLGGLCAQQALQTRAHYSAEMYLRLWIPELFSVCAKLIYLDADVIVRHSVHELYASDVSQAALAGVLDPSNLRHKEYVEKQLRVPAEQYVNSGVLLFNTSNCIAHKFRERCFNVLERYVQLNCPDQDMINIACQGNILLINPGWNYLWNYGFSKKRLPPDGQAWFQHSFEESKSKKYIVHFSSAIKPWNNIHDEDAEIFWNVAKKTVVYGLLLRRACLKKSGEILQQLKIQG